MKRQVTIILVIQMFLLESTQVTLAGAAEFTSITDWEAAVGAYNTITFTDFPKFTFITDQYEDLGVLFLDGDDNIQVNNNSFPPDMFGLDGNQSITMQFASPQNWLGVTFPGVVAIWLYSDDTLIHTAVFKDFGTPGAFAGLVSDQPFDRAVLFDPLDPDVNIGDLYFGPPIPAPGAIALLALGILTSPRRRRP